MNEILFAPLRDACLSRQVIGKADTYFKITATIWKFHTYCKNWGRSVAILLVALLINNGTFAQERITPAAKQKNTKPIKLFNGKDLDGWYIFLKDRGRDNDPKKVFTVRDGMLHISGEEWGCITTEEEYENYKLTLEFKWGGGTHEPRKDNARDSGVLLHSQGEDGGYNGTWMHSIECQIIEGGTGDFIVVGNGTPEFSITGTVAPQKQGSSFVFLPGGEEATIHSGRINWFARDPDWKDVIGFRGEKDIGKPVGKWNKMECIAKGDEIFVIVNGVLVNYAKNVRPRKGRIQIQSEAAEIVFRKVELTPIN